MACVFLYIITFFFKRVQADKKHRDVNTINPLASEGVFRHTAHKDGFGML